MELRYSHIKEPSSQCPDRGSSFAPADSKIYDTLSTGNRPVYNNAMKKSSDFEGHRRFKEGREDVQDDPRSGQPKTLLYASVLFCKLCIFIFMFMYSYCYVCSVLGILFLFVLYIK